MQINIDQRLSWGVKGHTGHHEPSSSGGTVPQEHEIPHHTQSNRQHTRLIHRGKKYVCLTSLY